MSQSHFSKAALLMLLIVVIAVSCWEFHWRSRNYQLSYNDDEALWTHYRKKVYLPAGEATVFIGSSRIKFDLDIPTWEQVTGEKAIQLANHGSCPRLALEDLGNDAHFKGKLIVDVTEGLFFTTREDHTMISELKYYHDATPAQNAGACIDFGLESQLLFLDKDLFSLNAMLIDLRLPDRKGVRGDVIFPPKFNYNTFQRQEVMTDEFATDTSMQRWQTDIWTMFGALSKDPGEGGDTLQKIFNQVQTAVAKIKARGGKVIFTRTPSSGGYWDNEPVSYPRSAYFDKLLTLTGCEGIHFKDDPKTAGLVCPEWSHLKRSDAVIYTRALAASLRQLHWFSK